MFCCRCQSAKYSSWLLYLSKAMSHMVLTRERNHADKEKALLICFLNLQIDGKNPKRHWQELSENQLTFAEHHFMWLIGKHRNGYEPCSISASCIQCTLTQQINWCYSHRNDDVASAPVFLQPQELRSHLVTHVTQTTLIMHETQSAVICCAAVPDGN